MAKWKGAVGPKMLGTLKNPVCDVKGKMDLPVVPKGWHLFDLQPDL